MIYLFLLNLFFLFSANNLNAMEQKAACQSIDEKEKVEINFFIKSIKKEICILKKENKRLKQEKNKLYNYIIGLEQITEDNRTNVICLKDVVIPSAHQNRSQKKELDALIIEINKLEIEKEKLMLELKEKK